MKIEKINKSIVFENDDIKTILPLNNVLFINNGNTFTFRTKSGKRLFSVKYDEITVPSSTSVEDLINKLNSLLNAASGGGTCNLQDKNIVITANGRQEIVPDATYDGFSKIDLDVNVPSTGTTVVNGRMYVTNMADEGFSAQQAYNSVQMPNDMSNVTSLANAFADQSTLEEVVFPQSIPNVTSLASTFNNCTNLHSANVNAPLVTDMSNAYRLVSKLNIQDIKIPQSIVTMEGCFNGFGNNGEVIEEYVLENLPNLTNLNSAFGLCTWAKKFTLRNLPSLTNVNSCFNYSNIEEIDASEIGVTDLGRMFDSCSNVRRILLPNNLEKVEDFFQCSELVSIDLPSTLIKMPTFNACSKLETINGLQEILPNITEGGFGFTATRLTSLDLSAKNPAFIPELLSSTFSSCDLLTEINLDNWDLTNVMVYEDIFSGCFSLTKISLNNSNFTSYAKLKQALNTVGLQDQVTISPTYEPSGTDLEFEFNSEEMPEIYVTLNDQQYLITESPYSGNTYTLTNGVLVNNINRLFADQVILTRVNKIPTVDAANGAFQELFMNCNNLTEVNMSNSINGTMDFAAYWFAECSSLVTIYMDGLHFFDFAYFENVFTNCTSLKTIYLRNSDEATKNKIIEALTNDGIVENVTVITE